MVDVYDQKVERLIESLGDGQNTFLSGSGGVGQLSVLRQGIVYHRTGYFGQWGHLSVTGVLSPM